MAKVVDIDLNDFVRDNYITYGKEVDLLRVVPNMYDGLKPVYRKLILSMLTFPKDKFIETVTVIGHCKSKYYVHGDASLEGVVDRLVQCGIFVGKGTFGYSTLLKDIGGAACLSGDTLIPLRDGRILSIKELTEKFNSGEKLYVHSCDEHGTPHSGLVTNALLTRKNSKLVKVYLDNGEVIKCTSDHKFMMRDGSYKRADELNPNDSLMPFYTKVGIRNKGWDTKDIFIKDNLSGEWIRSHYIDINELDKDKNFDSSKKVNIHHKDLNHLNNNPDNLIIMNESEHLKLHNSLNPVKGFQRLSSKEKSEIVSRTRHNMYVDNTDYWSKEYSRISNSQSHDCRVNSRKLLHRNWCFKLYSMILALHTPDEVTELTWDSYVTEATKGKGINKAYIKYWNVISNKYFESMDQLKLEYSTYNHKVVKIEYSDEYDDVYDITVNKYHNFALTSGIYVHNCRYTKVMLNPRYREMIDNLLPFVPKFQNDIDVMEPEFIPTPIPLGILAGSLGLGVGLVQRMPPLNPKSVIEAMRADDYTKIESAYGFKLSLEDKRAFWDNESFSFNYVFPWTKIPGGYRIDGNGDWVKPRLPDMYKKEDEAHEYPLYEVIDNFGKNRSDIEIYPIGSSIGDEDIDKACHVKVGNILWVVNAKKNRVELVTGRNLLKNCFDNYGVLYLRWKNNELHKLNIELEAFENFKEIANLIINTNKSEQSIMDELKLSCIEVVQQVSKMPVGSLRTYDSKKKVKSIKDKIKEVEKYSVDDILNKFE